MPMWQSGPIAAVWVCLVGCVATSQGYWLGDCGGYAGPLPLAPLGNSDLDCKLKGLGLRFGLQVMGGGSRAEKQQSRLAAALNVAACNATGELSTAAAAPSGGVAASETEGGMHTAVPAATARLAVTDQIARVARRAGVSVSTITQLFVASNGSDTTGTGSVTAPFATIQRGLVAVASLPLRGRPPVVLWLREGVYFEPVEISPLHSGSTAASPVLIAGHPNEAVTISGGMPLTNLEWAPTTVTPGGATVYKAALTAPLANGALTFNGLFGLSPAAAATASAGDRLTRARYPNCADIAGPSCYLLNATGAAGKSPTAPVTSVADIPGAINVEVKNQHGFDMFAYKSDTPVTAAGPNGASDGTLPPGVNISLTVDHPDFAWRCVDCGFGGFSEWRSYTSAAPDYASRFNSTYNEPFWDQQVSGGFYFSTAPTNDWAPGWTPRTWANASTGVVHMYHGNQWGGWQFRLAARNDTASSLTFACTVLDQSDTSGAAGRVTVPCPLDGSAAIVEGGWQEARGGSVSAKSSFFVDNIKEELDAPGEWFFDPDEGAHGTLYLIPLTDLTGVSQPPDSSQLLVATVRKRIVTIIGNSTATPVRNVVLANVTVAHADATYLDQFEVPSGGDWAIHRGGAVFVDTAVGVTISGVTVDKVDGSGVFFSRYVRNSSVADSNFYEIGETAVLVVGASGKHRTNMASTLDYPAFNTIERNWVDTVGVWVKQSAAYFKAIARANTIRSNVFMNGPRSGVNFNDGAMGGEVLEGNLMLGFVRESNDHGPFNSWGRQPYVYRINEWDSRIEPAPDGTPRLAISPQTQRITANLIFSYNFHGPSCASTAVDHDDGSSQYVDARNVLLYGGLKMFDGMDRAAHDNLMVYPMGVMHGKQCYHALQSRLNRSAAHSQFVSNHCVMLPGQVPYNCGAGPAPFYNQTEHVATGNNTFSYPGGNWSVASQGWPEACMCWPRAGSGAPSCPIETFADWQKLGLDPGSKVQLMLSNEAIIEEAEDLLGLKSEHSVKPDEASIMAN